MTSARVRERLLDEPPYLTGYGLRGVRRRLRAAFAHAGQMIGWMRGCGASRRAGRWFETQSDNRTPVGRRGVPRFYGLRNYTPVRAHLAQARDAACSMGGWVLNRPENCAPQRRQRWFTMYMCAVAGSPASPLRRALLELARAPARHQDRAWSSRRSGRLVTPAARDRELYNVAANRQQDDRTSMSSGLRCRVALPKPPNIIREAEGLARSCRRSGDHGDDGADQDVAFAERGPARAR